MSATGPQEAFISAGAVVYNEQFSTMTAGWTAAVNANAPMWDNIRDTQGALKWVATAAGNSAVRGPLFSVSESATETVTISVSNGGVAARALRPVIDVFNALGYPVGSDSFYPASGTTIATGTTFTTITYSFVIPLMATQARINVQAMSAAATDTFYVTLVSVSEAVSSAGSLAYNPSYRWSFETGDTSQWAEVFGTPPTIQRISLGGFPYRARFVADANTRASFDAGANPAVRRTEATDYRLANSGPITRGTVQVWAWTTLFEQITSPKSWLLFLDFHHTGPTGSTPFWFGVTPNQASPRISLYTKSSSFDLGPITIGSPMNFVVLVTWHDDPTQGRATVRINGTTVVNNAACQNLYSDGSGGVLGMYPQQGLYGNLYQTGTTPEPIAIASHAGLRWGLTEASVTLGATSTTQPPTTKVTTQAPTTLPPTTQPPTTKVATTQPPTTLPPTQPPTTQPPTAKPATTVPLTTMSPTTLPPTTKPATTQPLTTQPLTTLPAVTTAMPTSTQPATTVAVTSTMPLTTTQTPVITLPKITTETPVTTLPDTTAPTTSAEVPTNAPVDTRTAPVDTSTAPVDTSTAPVDTTLVPVDTTSAPTKPVGTTPVATKPTAVRQ